MKDENGKEVTEKELIKASNINSPKTLYIVCHDIFNDHLNYAV